MFEQVCLLGIIYTTLVIGSLHGKKLSQRWRTKKFILTLGARAGYLMYKVVFPFLSFLPLDLFPAFNGSFVNGGSKPRTDGSFSPQYSV